MFRSLNLEDYMLKHPIKVKPDDNVMEAVDLIVKNKISGLCVVDDMNQLVGVLSELDCLRAILSATYNEGSIGTVAEHMTTSDLITAAPNEDIVDVAQDMLHHNKRRRPVIIDGKLVGQITCRQLLTAVKNFQGK
jgi:CBS domain-containing protein